MIRLPILKDEFCVSGKALAGIANKAGFRTESSNKGPRHALEKIRQEIRALQEKADQH